MKFPDTDQGHLRQAAINIYNYSVELNRPSFLFKPKLSIDGDMWCALYGDDLQDGVAGFGISPYAALYDFDNKWTENLKK